MVLYGLGSNGSGQLGINSTDDTPEPRRCSFGSANENDAVIRVSAGGNHTLVLLQSGEVWSTGTNAPFSTSVSVHDSVTAFGRVTAETEDGVRLQEKFELCSATWEASFLICFEKRRSRVLVCGQGTKGELGLGENIVSTNSEMKWMSLFPPNGTKIGDIKGGVGHTVVVLDNGELWGWGNGRKGQLGESVSTMAWTPTKIEGVNFEAHRIACGREFTAVMGRQGELMILGREKWGVKSGAPKDSVLGIIDMQASWCGIYLLSSDGNITSWGRNDRGQLAPTGLPLVTQVAVGSEHAIARTVDGEVVAWGWGEHGNCGGEVDENGNVTPGRWNVLWQEKKAGGGLVRAVGAGCATSWIDR